MRAALLNIFATLALLGQGAATPLASLDKRSTETTNGIKYKVFEHAATGGKTKIVSNSGICETTPGVNQHSGYFTVGDNMNMFFWFFESRKNAKTAPLALWLNGGPGCSSMIGLFQENGPCTFNNGGSKPTLNPNSWNTFANMLYVDQPIGTGFSYGTDDVTSTLTAAPRVWKLLQAFYAQFPEYEGREFGLFTESYGGHYGPEFAFYFEQQNAAIDAGKIQGEKINLVALGINNGWIDPANQYKDYIDYAANNTYRKLINDKQYTSYVSTYQKKCVPAFAKCTGLTANDDACGNADDTCNSAIESSLESLADFGYYDIRHPRDDPFPPATYSTYLQSSAVMKAIGTQSTYGECPDAPYQKFMSSGDRGRSFLPTLKQVIDSNITVLIWAGDADWICNWMGNYRALNSISSKSFLAQPLKPYTVNGKKYGEFKASGNLSWLRVYEAGHEVPAYQPEAALAAFIATMSKKPISSS
ncbi:carboxypeptidase D [Fusarium albosuccineum]|uniref:Carboxypeptidase n=1 Tax=Fusarium albosuccineum TaxID=1237068 RepID=A0A8H4L3W0_9HYPO|nr:carboxypeptidase D [Fusarium albosuccineum]